jgi:ketosteroid isomerase-like protein
MSHIPTVQAIYAAFGRGDIETILGHLADDVVWEYDKPAAGIPWLVPLRGRAQVPGFFAALAAVEFQQFQPKLQLESGNIVVGLNDVAFTVRATGKRVVEEDEIHIWHFDASGRVARFCHKTDTLQHWLALQTA